MPSTYTNLKYHLVFGTKMRRELILPPLEERLYAYLAGVIQKRRGMLIEGNGMPDHVHLLVGFRAAVSISEMLHKIKGASSRWMNKQLADQETFAWQEGYAAFTVSESNVEAVRKYIRRQKEHHRRQSFEDEMDLLLRRHGMELDREGFCK